MQGEKGVQKKRGADEKHFSPKRREKKNHVHGGES